jgi:hypothetical protein
MPSPNLTDSCLLRLWAATRRWKFTVIRTEKYTEAPETNPTACPFFIVVELFHFPYSVLPYFPLQQHSHRVYLNDDSDTRSSSLPTKSLDWFTGIARWNGPTAVNSQGKPRTPSSVSSMGLISVDSHAWLTWKWRVYFVLIFRNFCICIMGVRYAGD